MERKQRIPVRQTQTLMRNDHGTGTWLGLALFSWLAALFCWGFVKYGVARGIGVLLFQNFRAYTHFCGFVLEEQVDDFDILERSDLLLLRLEM